MSFIRFAALMFSAFLLAGCGSVAYETAVDGIADGSLIRKVGVAKEQVVVQAPCEVSMKLAGGPCVFIETQADIYFLRFDKNKYSYEPLTQLKIKDIPAVAYASFGMGKQVQIKLGEKWLAFNIVGSTVGNTEATRAAYDRLVAHGVNAVEPQPFIIAPPQTTTIYY